MTNVISGLIVILILVLVAWSIREIVGYKLIKQDNRYRAEFSKDYFKQNVELSRCQKANAALREKVTNLQGLRRHDNLHMQDLQRQLDAAQIAASRPAAPDPDREPTFTEIVTEIASHVSTFKEDTAPEPVNQIVAGTVVTTPSHTEVDNG